MDDRPRSPGLYLAPFAGSSSRWPSRAGRSSLSAISVAGAGSPDDPQASRRVTGGFVCLGGCAGSRGVVHSTTKPRTHRWKQDR
jgi:hypothetical protein